MFELTGAAALLQTLGWLYAVIALTALGLALYLPKKWWLKVALCAAVIAIFVGYPVTKVQEVKAENDKKTAAFQTKLAKAQALFAERCKTAGEKIYRTVENVEGVFLINPRATPTSKELDDQFARYDPYGYEGGGTEYIKSFLAGYWKSCVGVEPTCSDKRKAFKFVELRNTQDKVERYQSVDKQTEKPFLSGAISIAKLTVENPEALAAKYGVEWVDISTDEDRQHWIAGGEIKIIDLSSKSLIASRRGYFMDSGQGSTNGQRQPWAWARQYTQGCPPVENHNFVFIRSILKPSQGE
jgi:hypothetical protein